MTAAVQKILEEVKALSPAEQQEIEEALAGTHRNESESNREHEAALQLAQDGVITPARRPLRTVAPATIAGQPASEIIIAERR